MPAHPPRDQTATAPAPPAPRVVARRKSEIDAALRTIFAQIEDSRASALPSVLISGTIRCGKTKVANKLSRRTGLVHIKTDEIRNALYLDVSETDKRRIVKYVFRCLLLRFPNGILIDGTALMDAPCELPLWASKRSFAFHAIGYSFDKPKAKHRDLLAYRAMASCWTKRSKSDDEMLRFARRLIRRSQEIKHFCKAHGLSYFDLDSSAFDSERDRILRSIERDLRARTPGTVARLRSWMQKGPTGGTG